MKSQGESSSKFSAVDLPIYKFYNQVKCKTLSRIKLKERKNEEY